MDPALRVEEQDAVVLNVEEVLQGERSPPSEVRETAQRAEFETLRKALERTR